MVVPADNSLNRSFESSSSLTSGDPRGGVIVDIGTGDGRFVYQCARQNPDKFYLGIDANAKALEKISMKASRRSTKGGAPNLLFIQASVEDLPSELNSVADEIHIHFPWGSLLGAVATGDEAVLRALKRISAPGCLLEVVIGIDPRRDRAEIERLGLPALSGEYFETYLRPRYEAVGFAIREHGQVSADSWAGLQTSWARRLSGNAQREVVYFVAEARE